MPPARPLREDAQADVCVVGAGIAGLTTAYLLAQEGKSVAVLEAGSIGSGESGRTTAHLSCAIDDRFVEIERLHGPEGARISAASHREAIDAIERIVRQEAIDCDFERLDGYLFHGTANDEERTVSLAEELEAAHRAGLEDAEIVGNGPGGTFDRGGCLRFPRQGQFHPLKYLSALARSILRDRGALHTESRVVELEGEAPIRVATESGPAVTATDVVLATNSPIQRWPGIQTKQAPYRTYVIAAPVPAGSLPHALWWDTLDPYHYVRLAPSPDGRPDRELLIVGGEDRKPGDPEDTAERFEVLEGWARSRFPMMEEPAFRWSGQVMEPVDGVAYIGRASGDDSHVYVVTGDSGMGMTHGTIGGLLITDLIMGRPCRWADLYDPGRTALGSIGTLLHEAAGVAGRIARWVTPGEVGSADEIPPGSGAILRRGLTKLAVYRDPEGDLHEFSAACTHLGCVVAWDPVARSWDCPCHGSRFNPYGQVLNGPAVRALDPAGRD